VSSDRKAIVEKVAKEKPKVIIAVDLYGVPYMRDPVNC
jgi:dTDP-4-amino-4,6-dideoxygalactose transaminase